MADSDFPGLMAQLSDLYERGEYAKALELATAQTTRFPDCAAALFHERACLAARLGDSSLAVRLLQEALDADCWFPEFALREDEDLQLLTGLPEFERLVAASVTKQAEVHERLGIKPRLLLLESPAAGPHPLLMAFHSNNATVAQSAEFWRSSTPPNWAVALPESGQLSWWDRRSLAWFDLDWAECEVREHWRSLSKEASIDRNRVVVAGFSRSGLLAVRMVLNRAIGAMGFIAIGPAVRQSDLQRLANMPDERQPRGVRGYVILGAQDKWAPGARSLVNILRDHGIAVEVEPHPDMGHQFPPDLAWSLSRGLAFLTGD